VKPPVAKPNAPITISGSVRNTGTLAIASPVAHALIGQRPLSTRDAVSDWATSTTSEDEQSLVVVARTSLGKSLAPGAGAAFTLTIPAKAISHQASFAVLPLRVEAAAAKSTAPQRSGGVHTFLPTLASVKKYEPLSLAWLMPLTLDPDPALHQLPGPARTAAWAKAIGPGSRLVRLIQGTQNANVTWAIDPAILGPRGTAPTVDSPGAPAPSPSASPASPAAPTPQATPTPRPSPRPSPTPSPRPAPRPGPSQLPSQGITPAADSVTVATTALAKRLKAAAPRHTLWSLPYADPDLAALLPITAGNRVLNEVIRHPSTLDVAVGPARTDIAWPLGLALTTRNQARLRRTFTPTGLAGVVTSSLPLGGLNGSTADATHKSSSGMPLLAYDEPLSRTVAQTSSGATGVITVQRFLADSMALLGERPGTLNRSVLIAEPRTFAGDPAVLQSLFAAVAKAPWLVPATTGQLLAASRKLPPQASVQRTPDTDKTDSPPSSLTSRQTPRDPLRAGTSPLTSDQLDAIPPTLASITGIASILSNGSPFAVSWSDAQIQKLSARWRGHPEGLRAIDTATSTALTTVSRSVRVAPNFTNFFADRGFLQVTVVNDLAVPIHDVHLTLNPAQPRLRIEEQPAPLRVGAKSRVNVRLPVTSIAAGLVSVQAVLSTPNGTSLGQTARVNVRVQPPGTWIFWALGGLAGLILVLGLYRSVRRGSTRASRPHAQKLVLHEQ
jgi:hypothetical protein